MRIKIRSVEEKATLLDGTPFVQMDDRDGVPSPGDRIEVDGVLIALVRHRTREYEITTHGHVGRLIGYRLDVEAVAHGVTRSL